MCWDSWGSKELDTTERLNRTELKGLSNIFYIVASGWRDMKVRINLRNSTMYVRQLPSL